MELRTHEDPELDEVAGGQASATLTVTNLSASGPNMATASAVT